MIEQVIGHKEMYVRGVVAVNSHSRTEKILMDSAFRGHGHHQSPSRILDNCDEFGKVTIKDDWVTKFDGTVTKVIYENIPYGSEQPRRLIISFGQYVAEGKPVRLRRTDISRYEKN